ncbi:NAD(P)/FAD-dependent oxidoreductase [Planctomycetota bacterium]
MTAKPRVVVLGGGFAGLESAFYLRWKLKDKAQLTLVSDREYFLFKPNTIYVPFGEDPEKFKIHLDKPTKRRDIGFVHGHVREIDPNAKKVQADGKKLDYDYLIVATGADMRPEEVPGFKEHALTVWTPEDMLRLRDGFKRLLEKALAGERQRLLFLVPPNNRCSGPLYEIVMMTDTWLRRQKGRDKVEITWTTFEEGYIQAFGPRLNTVVTDEFEERKITGLKGFVVTSVEPGVVHYQNGEKREFDLLVSFPPYIASQEYPVFPHDDRGFVEVEADSRRVKGHANVFAVGDAADFPVKQAYLALLQADAAADHLAAEIEGKSAEVNFEPMSMCVMEELNKATFAQVPLKYTGDPSKPVAVDLEDAEHYKVGVSPLWRVGKKVLGLYLPWRFGSGKPFHAGFAWEAMDLGLKVMSKLMAK